MRWIPILLVALPSLAFSQRFTISGYVKDAATGESLIGSAILNRKTLQGSTANVHGFYSITLPSDSVQMVYSYVGYAPIEIRLLLKRDTTIDIGLNNANQLDEVVVNATRADQIQEVTQMSSVNVPIEQMKNLPALLGQVDVLKVLQLMPGVKSSEGSTGLYVRGGGPDQNLMLLDGVPVYNASHLFGFFSVFNADAINRVELIKGGFPARYGGRLSSVIDINMKDGNMKEVHGEGSVDIIAAKFTVEGPIKKDKTSFLVSARRTYIDVLAAPFIIAANSANGDSKTRAGYFFYDLNTKFNHIINKRNRIYLSTYLGDDKAYAKDKLDTDNQKYNDEFGLKWGNVITAFRWNNVVGPRLFSNLTATYSKYRFTIYNTSDYQSRDFNTNEWRKEYYHTEYFSGIRDWALKMDYDFVPSPAHYVRFGVGGIAHRFSPGAYTYNMEDTEADTTVGAKRIDAFEFSSYVEDDIKITDELKVNFGAHLGAFNVDNRWYYSVQPRASGRYLITNDLSVKASFASMMQFIHLLTNAGLGLPTDLWVPSTANVRPQRATQYAIGLARNFKSIYEVSLEGYYKKMYNLIEYKEGTSFLNTQEDWQDKVAVNGKGESYGSELLLQKKTGKVTGWIGYTLSWTYRQFDELNNGKWFPYKYDRRHDVSVAMTHAWNERMDFSMAWVYGTGNAVTLPTSTYKSSPTFTPNNAFQSFGYEIYNYGDRNSFRMRSYHRLDISFSWWKTKKWGRSKWTLAVYNVYSRRNPFFMNLTYDETGQRKFAQYSLFPIIPSINYSFKF
jgi:outer membrane cobalamin receptor